VSTLALFVAALFASPRELMQRCVWQLRRAVVPSQALAWQQSKRIEEAASKTLDTLTLLSYLGYAYSLLWREQAKPKRLKYTQAPANTGDDKNHVRPQLQPCLALAVCAPVAA
jgi:hypothetical protein